ncbi:hypothetical protein [Thermococcus sp.]
MVTRVGYKNKLVKVEDGFVYVFDGKLWSAPLERIVEYHVRGSEALPKPLREIAGDVYRILLEKKEISPMQFRVNQDQWETTLG